LSGSLYLHLVSHKLKIAFDAKRLFHNREGLGAYARTLISDLKKLYPQHEYILCTTSFTSEDYTIEFLDETKYTIMTPPKLQSSALWRSKTIVSDLEAANVDVYFGLSNELPFGIRQSKVKALVTIHDMLYKEFPQQFSGVDRWIYNKKFRHALDASELVFTTSKHTKNDIIKHFSHSAKKIHVAYQPVHSAYRNNNIKVNDKPKHYLVVGTINERKNLEYVIEAYRLMKTKDHRKVIVVGDGGSYKVEMQKLIKSYGLDQWFDFVGKISDNALIQLYKNALALIFPSKYEGFGRPILEALTLGTLVIASNNSSLPEVMGKYGIIIEYDRPESLVEAIIKVNNLSDRNADHSHYLGVVI